MKKSKRREEYGFYEEINLVRYYRTQGHEAPGTAKARAWYLMGIKVALKGDEYDQRNYAYYYDCQKHYQPYERKGLAYFEKAAQCFRRSAELGNEKIDIIRYDEDLATYVKAALSPATVLSVTVVEERSCQVKVAQDQLSLAIGREGQNAKLAAKLTGCKIDIKA